MTTIRNVKDHYRQLIQTSADKIVILRSQLDEELTYIGELNRKLFQQEHQ